MHTYTIYIYIRKQTHKYIYMKAAIPQPLAAPGAVYGPELLVGTQHLPSTRLQQPAPDGAGTGKRRWKNMGISPQ